MPQHVQPVILLILDGWGYRSDAAHNAIAQAQAPVWRRLWQERPHTLISASGRDVGLPRGQMGNSEVGHTHLGAGRVVYQDLTRISQALEDGSFQQNEVLAAAVATVVQKKTKLHIMGLLSDGGVHSHIDHIEAMVALAVARGAGEVCVHAFLDGRDTPPRSAAGYLQKLSASLPAAARISSLCGRYYAMDRDNNWSRMQSAWDLIVDGEAPFHADSAAQGLAQAYARGENDEFVQATRIGEVTRVEDGDAVIFMNFRADRARQLSRAFTAAEVPTLVRRRRPHCSSFVQLTEYAEEIKAPVAFPPQSLQRVFGEYLAEQGCHQLRIAETEKYAHVTFFFNGGREEPFPGEDRILIPSPKVATFDLQPEMSVDAITERLIAALRERRYEAVICNFANGDQVGHTGIMAAAIEAVEAVDRCLGRLLPVLAEVGAEMIITADHGNVECMLDEAAGQPLTAHTTNPVPLIYVGPRALSLRPDGGSLVDVAPTLLSLMGLPVPTEMTGHSLIEFHE